MIPYNQSFASHHRSSYFSDKNQCLPTDIYIKSNKKYIFWCDCGHEFSASPNKVSYGGWCPYCSIPCKKLCGNGTCTVCYSKSFASHERSKYLTDKTIDPLVIMKGSDNTYSFTCETCRHTFDKTICKVVNEGRWCPYCTNQKLCDNESCTYCYQKSLASHPKAYQFSNKNEGVSPLNIFIHSDKEYWFKCDCNHEFKAPVKTVTRSKMCVYCSNQRLCNDNQCMVCYHKSFASHEKVSYWSVDNSVFPRDVFKSSDKKFMFNCSNGHIFSSILYNISNGRWCPVCKNKGEQKLYTKLKSDYNVDLQFKAEWCSSPTTGKLLPFDYVIKDHMVIIELDGRQHFEQVHNWASPDDQLVNDVYKMKCANRNGYSVIRITHTDVWNDVYDWYTVLKDTIESVVNNGNVNNYFISYEDTVYDDMIKLI